MNEQTIKEINEELAIRKEKQKTLDWLLFLNRLKEKLSKEDLEYLFDGIEIIKIEERISGYNLHKLNTINLISNKIKKLKEISNNKIDDYTRCFIEKLIVNLEKFLEVIKNE